MHWGAQFALLAVAAIWGWTFVLVKESVREVSPFLFLFARFTLATLVLLLIFRRPLRLAWNRQTLWRGGLIGTALAAGYFFQTWGLVYTTATQSGFITGLSVVIVPLLGRYFGEQIGVRAWLGTGLSLVGLALILLVGQGGSLREIFSPLNIGDLLTLGCAFSFAVHILLIGRLVDMKNYPALLVIQIAAVALWSWGGTLALESVRFDFSATVWRAIIITGLFATALAFWAQNKFQPLATPTRTAIIFSSEPVFAGLFGFWLLGERLVAEQWAGAGFILAAMVISQWPPQRGSGRARPE
jgi:drug/metabolite transporter (DMT)-like permease